MKNKYRIKNWSEYNKSLINRGSITFWFDEESIRNWYNTSHTQEAGRPRIYSDQAILCALMVKTVFKMPYRALVGFLISLISILACGLITPSFSQICRRAKDLWKALPKLSQKRPTDIVFDSTGLKVYGEGEWKVKVHGKSKRRTWRKLHIGVDPDSKEILVSELTLNSKGDGQIAQKLIKETPKTVKKAYGDGAYDGIEFRQAVYERGAEVIVPPPRGAIVHDESTNEALTARDNDVLEIAGLGGDEQARKWWKLLHGYHRRSLGETTMYRIKQLTGGELFSRLIDQQRSESHVKCLIVNKITRLGMPKGVWES